MNKSVARRFRNLRVESHAGLQVFVAESYWSRLLGLSWLKRKDLPDEHGLLLNKTFSIHTAGMFFAIDLIWLDSNEQILRVDRGVKPWTSRTCRGAKAVIELRHGRANLT